MQHKSWSRFGSRVLQACGLYLSQLSHQDAPVYIPCLCPLINSSWPLSLFAPRAAVFVSALIFSSFPFLPHVPPWELLLLNVKWGHGHTWMCCDKLAQRRQMVMGRRLVVMPFAAATWIDLRAAEQPHMLHLCNPDFGYPPYAQTRTPQRTLTRMPPYTSLPSPLVSMMCAAEALANCQRLSARLRSERWRGAEGLDRDTELRLMVGWWRSGSHNTQPTTEGHTITDVLYMSAGSPCKQAAVFTELLS